MLIGIGSAMTIAVLFAAGIGASVGHCSDVIILGADLVIVNNASRVHPESNAAEAHVDVSRIRTMLFDLSRRQDDPRTVPPASGALPIFSYRF